MKNITLLIVFVFALSTSGFAQLVKGDNGLYYNTNNELYNGAYTEYFANGQPKLKMTLVKGKKDGAVQLFNQQGAQTELRSYALGQKHGEWLIYNEKGLKTSQANFTNGKKDGIWKIWNDNGVLITKMKYKAGVKVGTWKQFDNKGGQVAERQF